MAKHTIDELRQWQALPLSLKIRMTEERVRMWVREYGEDGVYVSFSGGKDSTVLLDIVRNRMGYTDIPAVFVDTGLEYPEIRAFVKTFPNVVWLRPNMQFRKVIEKYGYPMFSKENSLYIRQCQNPTEKNQTTRNLRLNGIRSDGVKVQKGQIPKSLQFMVNAPFKISEQCCDEMKKKPLHKATSGFPQLARSISPISTRLFIAFLTRYFVHLNRLAMFPVDTTHLCGGYGVVYVDISQFPIHRNTAFPSSVIPLLLPSVFFPSPNACTNIQNNRHNRCNDCLTHNSTQFLPCYHLVGIECYAYSYNILFRFPHSFFCSFVWSHILNRISNLFNRNPSFIIHLVGKDVADRDNIISANHILVVAFFDVSFPFRFDSFHNLLQTRFCPKRDAFTINQIL